MIKEKVLESFNGEEMPTNVFISKYSMEKEETPKDMHRRLAKEFARSLYKQGDFPELLRELWANFSSHNLIYSEYQGGKDFTKLQDLEDFIFFLFDNFKYIVPSGSVMEMLGNIYKVGSLSNCFVSDSPKDSYNSIMLRRLDQVNLMKRRGGVGKDLSKLRPRGAVVNNAARVSTGVRGFMGGDSDLTNEVAQDGRRGALMLTLSSEHPDLEDFITAKLDTTKITGANISVKFSDEFMQAALNDEDYILRFPIDAKFGPLMDFDDKEYDTLYQMYIGDQKVYYKKVKAKRLWDLTAEIATKSAEPGIMFSSKHINYSPDGVYPQFRFISTNPCGEIAMQANDSCRLIHLNLTSCVENPFTEDAYINYRKVSELSYYQMILGDTLVSLEIEAIDRIINHIYTNYDDDSSIEVDLWEKVKEQALRGRRCGCGHLGMADAIAMVGFKLASDGAMYEIQCISECMNKAQIRASVNMARTRGSFLDYNRDLEFSKNEDGKIVGKNPFFSNLIRYNTNYEKDIYKYGRRNLSWNTVAPTGTTSLMTGTSSGIEPVFKVVYMRRAKCMSKDARVDFVDSLGEKFTEYPVIHPTFIKWAMATKYPNKIYQEAKYILENLPKDDLMKLVEESPWYGSEAEDIDWKIRVRLQAIVQRFTTHSISSTVNLPKGTSPDVVRGIYEEAYKQNLKGITVYVDGSRSGILVNESTKDNAKFHKTEAVKRPKVLKAEVHNVVCKGVNYAVVVGLLDGRPYEIFVANNGDISVNSYKGTITKIKKQHYRFIAEDGFHVIENLNDNGNSDLEKSCALYTSMLLRHGADVHYVIKTAKKINPGISSFVSAMCRVLAKYDKVVTTESCPNCGGQVVNEGGCKKCLDCGESKCG